MIINLNASDVHEASIRRNRQFINHLARHCPRDETLSNWLLENYDIRFIFDSFGIITGAEIDDTSNILSFVALSLNLFSEQE